MKAEIINGKTISIKEISNQRLITFKEIDEVHERPEGTADRTFRENKKRFLEGVDYYKVTKSQNNEIRGIEIPNRGITLIAESGYLMLVKSFNDDLAWKVQRELVNTYFRAKTIVTEIKENNVTMENILQALFTQQQQILMLSQEQREDRQQQTAAITALTTLITSTLPQPYKPPFTRWMSNTYSKIDAIAEALGYTRRQMLHQLYNELQDTYDLDLNEYQEEYCYAHGLQNTGMYTLNTIGASSQLKTLFDLVINTHVEQHCSVPA